MNKEEQNFRFNPDHWNQISPLKLGAISIASSVLFDVNAFYHFKENGVLSVQGAIGLVLGELSLNTALGAFKKVRNLGINLDSFNSTDLDNL